MHLNGKIHGGTVLIKKQPLDIMKSANAKETSCKPLVVEDWNNVLSFLSYIHHISTL